MKKVVLGEVCDFFNGGAWSDKEYVNEGIPVLKVTNCKSTGFQLDNLNYLSEKSREKYKKNNLIIGDIIVATVGSHPNLIESAAGRSCIVDSQVEGFYLNQNAVCIRTKDKRILSQKYLGYLCKCADFQHYIQSRGRGAANQMRIAISSIKEYSFTLPDFENQQYIADILSAYDDLIENNQKQIKLLEEAAQRLYKEWFVDLRFPGHENTKIVDGVPEGWRVSSIYDVFDIKYGKNLPTSKITKVGQYPVYGASGVIGYYNEKNCDDYVTLITSRGNGSGDVRRTHHKQSYVTNNSFIARRNDKNIFIKNEFTFQLFSNTDFKKLCTGSAQPQLTNTSIQKIKIFLPNRQLIEKYQGCTIEMSEKQEVLYKEQRALTQARNRLLSKLINGTVEV